MSHVIAYMVIVLVSTAVVTFAMLEPAAFIVGLLVGAGVSAVAFVPALRRRIDRWLDGEDW